MYHPARKRQNLVTNGGFEVDSTGWANEATGVAARITTDAASGVACLQVDTTASGDGTRYTGTGHAGQGDTYTLSGKIKAKAAADIGAEIQFFATNVGGTFEIFAGAATLTADWQHFSLTFTWAEALHTGHAFVIRDAAIGGKNFLLDDVAYDEGSIASPFMNDTAEHYYHRTRSYRP